MKIEFMIPSESLRLSNELHALHISDHDRKVILAILEGQGTYNQEDIIDWNAYNQGMLRKLGVLRKVKTAARKAGINLS